MGQNPQVTFVWNTGLTGNCPGGTYLVAGFWGRYRNVALLRFRRSHR
jgi:hypothetical protein